MDEIKNWQLLNHYFNDCQRFRRLSFCKCRTNKLDKAQGGESLKPIAFFWFGWAVGLFSAWAGFFIANHIL